MTSIARQHAATASLVVAAFCIASLTFFGFSHVAENAREGAARDETVIRYIGKWRPTRAVLQADGTYSVPIYYPGETIYFNVERYCKLANGETMPILVVSSFQSIDDSTAYPGELVARLLKQDGTMKYTTIRRIPADIISGRYIVAGWAKTQSEKRPAISLFESEPFEVVDSSPSK